MIPITITACGCCPFYMSEIRQCGISDYVKQPARVPPPSIQRSTIPAGNSYERRRVWDCDVVPPWCPLRDMPAIAYLEPK